MSVRHIRPLDGVRGLAILLVIPHNSEELFHHTSGIVRLAGIVASAGWIGVQLFFVLSGFLITRNLLDSKGATNYFRVFFARRILRIFPLYYATLIVALIVVPLCLGTPLAHLFQRDELWLWLFMLNWAHPLGTSTYGLPHFWSLAVEEQFYFLWPFIVSRIAPRSLLKVCAGIAVAAFVIRTLMHFGGATGEMIYEFTVCRMDALAIGAATAVLFQDPAGIAWVKRWERYFVPVAVVLTLGGAFVTDAYTSSFVGTQTIGHTLLAVIFALTLLACVADEGQYNKLFQRVFDWSALRSVGRYSYGMYVLHFPIFLWLQTHSAVYDRTFGRWSPLAFVATMMILAYCAAFVSYQLLEKPFLSLKRFFVPQYGDAMPSSVPSVA